MAPTTPQDDYYAQMQSSAKSGGDDKKPLKLKLKAVAKKEEKEESAVESAPILKETSAEVSPVEHTPPEKPKARLVEREHASE